MNYRNSQSYMFITLLLVFVIHSSLSIFSYPTTDGSYYLLETSNMADILSNGQWIGNGAVGLHGFLFKLPVALLFMIFGTSVFIANISNVILATASGYLFYRILQKYFDESYFKIVGIIILATNYHFVLTTSSFLRESPVLFSFLLFIYLMINNKHKCLIGLSLLLILDAKEHVFFQLMPGFLLWLVYNHFLKMKGIKIVTRLKEFFKTCAFYFSPAVLYLLLMFFTGLVPINMFAAYALGLIERGFSRLLKSYSESGTYGGTLEEGLAQTTIAKHIGREKCMNNYLLKFFFPRMVSFLSIPKLVAIPALITSWFSFIHKDIVLKEDGKLYFLLLWSYFLLFYFRASHGRYFFPISPIVILFFLHFLRNIKSNRRNHIIILVTFIMIILGFGFEYNYLLVKILMNLVLMTALLVLLCHNKLECVKKSSACLVFAIILGFFTFSTALSASYHLEGGQLGRYLIHGKYGEIDKISHKISNDSIIWTNVDNIDLNLFKLFRGERISSPEARWKLKSNIPKKNMLEYHNNKRTFSFTFNNIVEFKEQLFEKNVDCIYLFYSTNPKRVYYKQEQIRLIESQDFLDLIDVMHLKNKQVYVFEVIK